MNVRPLLLALAWSLVVLGFGVDLEAIVTSPQGFGLTEASPAQRAICRMIQGAPLDELAGEPVVAEIVGGGQALATLPDSPARVVVLGAAVRCAKSTIVAAAAIDAAYEGDCSGLPPWEIPRVPIVSVDLDKSQETFSKLTGALMNSPALSSLLVKEPTANSVLLRNRSGRTVEIKMIANASAGKTLVSKWLLGCIFDEAPRMTGKEDGVVNLEEALAAIRARMRPGAQIFLVGSLYAPKGVVFDLVTTRLGKPGTDVLVIVGSGPQLRPELYTPDYCERIRQDDDQTYETDVMSRFAQPDEALLPALDVAAAFRAHDVPPPWNIGQAYVAIMDPATRGNGWTLVILTQSEAGKYEVAQAREWIGTRSAPLKPHLVLREVAAELAQYQLATVHTDQWGFDFLVSLSEIDELGLTFVPATRDDDVSGKTLKALISAKRLSLPLNPMLRRDLIALRRRPRQEGGSQIVLPKTRDGRHCDYGAAVLLGVQVLPDAPAATTESGTSPDEQAVLDMLNNRASHPLDFAGESLLAGDWNF